MKRRNVARIALSATIVLVAACTSCSDGAEQRPSGGVTSLHGGTLRLAAPDFATWFTYYSLDPQSYSAWEIFRCCLLRTLYSYNGKPTEEGGTEARPDLAAGMPQVSDDGLTWTFRLRRGLVYAPPFDDTPIVARDLVRALERTARVGEDGVWDYFVAVRGFEEYRSRDADSIVGLETPDDRTLVVRLEQVTSDLAHRFSLPTTAPIPAGASDGHKKDYERFVVASGPYMIEGSDRIDFSAPADAQAPASGYVPPIILKNFAVQTRGSLVLVRNPSWDPVVDRLRPAYPDRIEVTLGGDDDEIAALVDVGDLDMVFGASSPPEQVSLYREDPELAPRVYSNVDDAQQAVMINPAVPPFDDIHVRRAVALAIDRSALVTILALPQHGPFGEEETEIATHVAPDAMEGDLLDAFDPYPFDLARARAEMRLSAYDEDGDGRCDVSECRGIQTIVKTSAYSELAQAIAAGLKHIGIDLEPQIRPHDPFHAQLFDPRSHTPMSIAFGWGKDLPVGSGWFPPLFTFATKGCCNVSLLGASPSQLRSWGYSVASVPSVDDRIQRCLGRRGVAHTECWAELDQYLMSEVVTYVPYASSVRTHVVSDRVIEYSFDQFAAEPAFDRIAVTSGSG